MILKDSKSYLVLLLITINVANCEHFKFPEHRKEQQHEGEGDYSMINS